MQFDDLCRCLVMHHGAFACTPTRWYPLLDAHRFRAGGPYLNRTSPTRCSLRSSCALRAQSAAPTGVRTAMHGVAPDARSGKLFSRAGVVVVSRDWPARSGADQTPRRPSSAWKMIPWRQQCLGIGGWPVFVIEQVAYAAGSSSTITTPRSRWSSKDRTAEQPTG